MRATSVSWHPVSHWVVRHYLHGCKTWSSINEEVWEPRAEKNRWRQAKWNSIASSQGALSFVTLTNIFRMIIWKFMEWGIALSISVGLRAWRSRFRLLAGERDFSLFRNVHTNSRQQPTWRTSFNVFIYFTLLHVSNSTVFIIRRSVVLIHHLVCINTIDLLMMNTVLFETCRRVK